MIGRYSQTLEWSEEDRVEFARKLPESVRQFIQEVKTKIAKVHAVNKKYFDAKRREEIFKIGQKVWIRNHQLSDADKNINSKFLPKWLGPFQILSRNFDTYTVDVDSKLIPKRHVSDLKPFFEIPLKYSKPPTPLRKLVKDADPNIPVIRQLRAKTRVNYKRMC